jgi:hypothetical protein
MVCKYEENACDPVRAPCLGEFWRVSRERCGHRSLSSIMAWVAIALTAEQRTQHLFGGSVTINTIPTRGGFSRGNLEHTGHWDQHIDCVQSNCIVGSLTRRRLMGILQGTGNVDSGTRIIE